ncbi:TetR family transcriptional regulator [Labedaea rhizosphaerae]|uniref:TetR family transcriptional regulator n=1 Tax=Labedaea rhizosphaerae TaxID=598644 RepID=A0A4R6SCQ6_LABRH|nr:TetR family transcriptional regulator [Labedaea rhizosphaerae]TDP97357.1 TetR family transcriptional regulator [Labedaea rhizosphaerae]
MSDAVKRTYDSSRRRAQARQNQQRILAAATRLFAERGYGRTTLADVADAAGVAVETIYATFKNKPTLLHRAWDVAVGGDEQDVPLLERPELRALFAEPDLIRRLAGFAAVNTAIMRRTAELHLAVRGAASTDEAAATLLAEIDDQRLAAMTVHARAAKATGQLAVSEQDCRDILWSTTDGTLWYRLVRQRGWTDERYAGWLSQLWAAQLVA